MQLLIALALVAIAVRIGEEAPPAAVGGLPRFGLAGAVGIAVLVGFINSLMLTRWQRRTLEELWAGDETTAASGLHTASAAYREGAARERERLLPEHFQQQILADRPVNASPVLWLFAEPGG